MYDAVVGLGSNQGDRRRILALAISAISARGVVCACSALFEAPAVGGPDQPDFLNAAIRVRGNRSPSELLRELLGIEARFGRHRTERWGPRTLDLDLLWVDGVVSDDERLTLPHPRLLERRFALVPLLQIAPEARDPRTGLALRDALPLAGGELRRVEPPGWALILG